MLCRPPERPEAAGVYTVQTQPGPTRIPEMKKSLTALLAVPVLLTGPAACAATDYRKDGLGPPTDADLATYTEHLHVVASEYMQGRLPGTPGIDRAADYIQWQYEHLGLEPAFGDGTTFRQPFPIGDTAELEHQAMTVAIKNETKTLRPGEDFSTLGYGGSGKVDLPITFVGYSIPMGPEHYSSYPEGTDLSGRAAMILRYEPMNDDGSSRWLDKGWSYAATLTPKFRAAANRGAGAIIMVTPPMAKDHRGGVLETVATSGQGQPVDIPVIHVTPEIADMLIKAGDSEGRSLVELIEASNEGAVVVPLEGVHAMIDCRIDREPILTDNIGAILPGKGELADEYVVLGAHYDHLGKARFGSRFPGRMHLGADDNASGTAGVLTDAKILSEAYKHIDGPARSVLFLDFSAEESGLNGSRYYVEHPIAPLENHFLMVNMDMIGSLRSNLEIGGTGSAEGLADLVTPVFDRSGIHITTSTSVGAGRSDHASFDRAGVPNLFFFTGLTDQYHTPDDTADTINYEGAVRVAKLAADTVLAAALDEGTLAFVKTNEGPARSRRRIGGPGGVKIRVGIAPGDYSGQTEGVTIARVFPGTSAADAGLREGDRIIVWNGEKVKTIEDWMPMLASHEPGDTIDIVIIRDGKQMTIPITLKARGSRSE